LCGGPVHEADPGGYACEVGHRVGVEDLERHADHRLAEGLWMAIEALHNEAEVVRAVRSEGDGRLADDAEDQARTLPDFARRHAAHADV
jgi:hypothetical protein